MVATDNSIYISDKAKAKVLNLMKDLVYTDSETGQKFEQKGSTVLLR